MIKILIVDDHKILCEGIRSILKNRKNIDVIGIAADGNEAITKTEKLLPDIIIMDISMPNMDGLEASIIIKEKFPHIKIIVLSQFPDLKYIKQVIELDLSGYVLKYLDTDELIKAIDVVNKGGKYYSREISDLISTSLIEKDKNPHDSLNEREIKVLRFYVEGRTVMETAGSLNISDSMVEKMRISIKEKLDIKDRSDLLKYAIKNNII